MQLLITRHGETIENTKGIVQGHMQGKLSKLGKEQAKRLAKRLKDEEIDAIYSSDLARAADTAKEIAKYHKGTPLILVKELRERYVGSSQGKHKKEIKWLRNGSNILHVIANDGESIPELYNRAKKFVYKILHKHKNDCVLFVSHNGTVLALAGVITKKKPMGLLSMNRIDNTSLNIFEIDEDRNHKIHLLNCTKHLK